MISADDLRQLRLASERSKEAERATSAKSAATYEDSRISEAVHQHLTDPEWQTLLEKMRSAAAAGGTHCLLIRFPSAACTDHGRQINSGQEGWSATLRGRAADIYRRWGQDLRP